MPFTRKTVPDGNGYTVPQQGPSQAQRPKADPTSPPHPNQSPTPPPGKAKTPAHPPSPPPAADGNGDPSAPRNSSPPILLKVLCLLENLLVHLIAVNRRVAVLGQCHKKLRLVSLQSTGAEWLTGLGLIKVLHLPRPEGDGTERCFAIPDPDSDSAHLPFSHIEDFHAVGWFRKAFFNL
jgi:hypothetical protein